MSIVEDILRELWTTSVRYKGVRVNLFGIPCLGKHPSGSVRTTVYRLHKKGLIAPGDRSWYLTKAGKKYLRRKADSLLNFDFKFAKDAPKNLIVMYDIPENKKAEREWFRWHLKKFNYEMVQRSVWVGPSPLPKEFLNYLEKIKLRNAIKTFKLAKPYSFYKNN